ncbi:P-loop containing nucleoside triphosphate hydrolase protein [Dacryopinax primogenitus]|uniref:ATP-dependent DNA helicase n=1 Tax=Dacryopinax primogenitus (strain DJM 731) TaxID=1858805 RepID=M5FZC5_DACPD|nr:P-loop containing nucleoside triphosphate hydrolase protein [Dacryopinax primogenitus]EJT98921.1 P-loop containing nucleoside triphosphate hydrolase protein [Dacryopinax primogenitus]
MAPSRAGPFGRPNQRTKQWDRTQFAATGNKNKGRVKRKKRRRREDEETGEEEEEEEDLEWEQFPTSVVSSGPPPPMKLVTDPIAVREWIYPINKPIRDYQYNIVQAALFKNTLVALPTGLGKTFIAGVLMLNYYRWFPDGKVVFVAPTKPLVSQQIKACHETCGIPVEDAIEMTGETPQATRQRHWASKRIVYMTPQTLQNDLLREVVDPRDIILLVVDEAHKATGNYAYATVVRFMMAKNPHFRILALTATPGSKPKTVQDIIDSLHVGHIEIRDERSLDLKQYIHEKTMEKCVVQMGASINGIKERLLALMENTVKPLRGKDIFPDYVKVADIHPYSCKKWIDELRRKPQGRDFPWAAALLMRLHKLTFAMAYLCEESVEMAYNTLLDAAGKKLTTKEGGNKLSNDPKFRDLITEIENYRNERVTGGGPVGHPKMDKLVAVALEHFAAPDDGADSTRVMVFCQYRDCVDEIVKSLKLQQPIIRASKFVGQSSDKRGDRGMAQKDQIEIIRRFKQGDFNVLVATSIGEEGLDIGEVDLIICYDVQKSSIKMLQRIGRTGRKRSGKIVVLMAEGREETNWDAANENYSNVQETIIRGDQLELFDDDERLIPDDAKPIVRKQHMEIHPFVSQDTGGKKRRLVTDGNKGPAKRRKRNDDPNRNIPDGAFAGFISAAKLVRKGSKNTEDRLTVEGLQRDLEDDEDDADISRGRLSPTPDSSPPPEESRKAALSKISRARKSRAPDRRVSSSSTLDDLARELQDDSDDQELEAGLDNLLPPTRRVRVPRPCDIVEISSDEEPANRHPPPKPSGNGAVTFREEPANSRWLLESESENENSANTKDGAGRSAPNASAAAANKLTMELSPIQLSPVAPRTYLDVSTPARNVAANSSPDVPLVYGHGMGPPPIPAHKLTSDDSPFLIRRNSSLAKGRNTCPPNLPDKEAAPSSSPVRVKRTSKSSRSRLYSKPNPFFDVEADLSGSDHGESDDNDEEWSESDQRFIKNSPATQAVPKAEEHGIYLQGLMTQAPGRTNLGFRDGPVRRGPFGAWSGPKRHIPMSSSEADPNSEPNEYELGSFVVADDDSFEIDQVEADVSTFE